MAKLTETQLRMMANLFGYKALLERYTVMERIFDIQDGDTVIDFGSYHGDMCIYFSKKVGEDGNVYAFEAHPTNIRQLLRFIRYQKLNNVQVYPIALWNKKDTIPFYLSKYTNAGSPVREFRKVTDEYVDVQADTLDNILENKKIDFLWSNIECSEVQALEGAKNILMNNDCKVCISTHKINGNTTTDDVIRILKSYGYRTEPVKGHYRWIYGEKY